MRFTTLIASLAFAGSVLADETGALLLERAIQLETAVGDLQTAERIYVQIVQAGGGHRVRAEATYRLADLYSRQDKNAEAKTLFLQVLRDFPEASDLIPLAELELTKVTTSITREQLGTNVGSMHYIGDLAIALQGALENEEQERALELLQRLNATLESLSSDEDPPEILVRLNVITAEITAALLDKRTGSPRTALERLEKAKEFGPFLQRGFPSDPHDVFAPAWRLKDRLARAVAGNDLERTNEIGQALERYLAPVADLPPGPREGTLARITLFAARDVRSFATEGNFAEARRRLDEFDTERHEEFPEFRVIATLPMRMPEHAVGAAWVILFRTDLARRELSQRAYATAMDHVTEAAKVCRELLPRVENTEAAALIKKQLVALETALLEIQSDRSGDRLGQAQKHLKTVLQRSK